MTMKSYLVNAGNRTGDRLAIELVDPDPEKCKKRVISRGDKFDLWEFVGYSAESAPAIRIYVTEYSAGADEWADEPQITVTDKPRSM